MRVISYLRSITLWLSELEFGELRAYPKHQWALCFHGVII